MKREATHKISVQIGSTQRDIDAGSDETLLESLIGPEIFLKSNCGGKGRCGKCKVKVPASARGAVTPPDEEELKLLSAAEIGAGLRLACRTKASGSFALEIPETSLVSDEVIEKGTTVLFEKLAEFETTLKNNEVNTFGLAVDLGTTTIGIYLCNFSTGKIVASVMVKNPQAIFGDDVISRITMIDTDESTLSRLQKMAVKAIEWGVKRLCGFSQVNPSRIKKMVVVGNSTMIHIFLGRNPSSIGIFPYQPAFVEPQQVKADRIGLNFNSAVEVHTLPLISGYLGADIISAALAVDLQRAQPGTMLVDVGTNGEVMFKGGNGLLATSCATGPAFEGAVIRNGMQALSGAIDHVNINRATGEVNCSVIQKNHASNKRPSGICGSGVLSSVAALLESGILLNDGAFDRSENRACLQYDEKNHPKFILIPAEKSGQGHAITITQADIRAVQLAKGALRTGIDLICSEAGMERPEKILLAGAFGNFINKKDAMTIGMFPELSQRDIETIGNAAGVGAIMALFDERVLERAGEIIKNTRVVELSEHPDFQEVFISSLAFPNSYS